MKIIVTTKQVPDTHNIVGDAMRPDGTVNRSVLPTIFNPEDLNALEEALKLKEKIPSAHITAITMGPPKAMDVLRESLYRGADDVVLLSDGRFAGADTLATSYALKCAVQKLGVFDLIFCGRQAIDGDTAQVGPQLAEKLGINQITNVCEVVTVDEEGCTITVKRSTEYGEEIVKSKFPVLITVTSSANDPRPASAKRMMIYKSIGKKSDAVSYTDSAELAWTRDLPAPYINYIKEWNLESVDADPAICGLNGSPTKVKKIQNVVLVANEAKMVSGDDEGISALIKELVSEHILAG
ncbi:MAG: electron transfer flavoprotein subunit beta/FixA family protein [Oligoflexia bacterium]|nr:electron transfer flavoprotein subunit beta/FixA family protein [Oligoflexia bacterium]MBF0364416.1 electron transfer flavoprotein subunit beta/FixA family protein [Oligoflexia bacterium]